MIAAMTGSLHGASADHAAAGGWPGLRAGSVARLAWQPEVHSTGRKPSVDR